MHIKSVHKVGVPVGNELWRRPQIHLLLWASQIIPNKDSHFDPKSQAVIIVRSKIAFQLMLTFCEKSWTSCAGGLQLPNTSYSSLKSCTQNIHVVILFWHWKPFKMNKKIFWHWKPFENEQIHDNKNKSKQLKIIFKISLHTFHNFVTLSQTSAGRKEGNLGGRFINNFFFSFPMSEVQSKFPCLSVQIENDTPHALKASSNFLLWTPLSPCLDLLKSSL